ncbi:MAG: TorF family putative porin [Rhodospirillaceae bacterium]
MKCMVRLLSAMGLVAAMVAPFEVQAAESKSKFPGTFSANAGVVTEYRFRGLDQSDKNPAIQGGIDWNIDTGYEDTGVYVGMWGSNIDFNDGDDSSVEIDWYGGITGKVGAVGWDLGVVYFSYPGAASSRNYDFVEVGLGLSYDIGDTGVSVSANYNYSPDFFAGSGNAHWFTVGGSYAVPVDIMEGVTLEASVGRQIINDNTAFGQPDYTTWSLGATLGITSNVSAGISYQDTNITNSRLADTVVIGSLTARF